MPIHRLRNSEFVALSNLEMGFLKHIEFVMVIWLPLFVSMMREVFPIKYRGLWKYHSVIALELGYLSVMLAD